MLFMLFRNFGIWFHLEEKWYFRSQKPAIYFTVENEGFTLKLLLCRTSFYTEKNVSIQRRRRKNCYILNPYLAYNIEHFPKTLYISGTSLVTKMQNLKLEFRNENTPHWSWGGEIQNRQRWWQLNGEALAVINQFLPRKKRYKVEIGTQRGSYANPLSNIQSWAFHQTVLYFLDQPSNRYM